MARSLTFGILGPLRVERGREVLAPSGPRQQAVLAALLLRANEVVSTDALIEAVWGEDPPPTARTAVQVHVSKLRRLLEGDPRVEIETVPRGYRIRVDAEAVDALRFRALVQVGTHALAEGNSGRAADVLARALALWRGRPLEGVDAAGIPPFQLIEWEEEQVHASALLAEAALAAGRHAEALPDLERLRAEHPLDERITALTALALYRSGRQADALEVLAHLRRELSSELGIEPGPAAGKLESQILAHDPTLDSARPVAEASIRIGRKSVTALVARLPGPADGDPEAELARRGAEASAVTEAIGRFGGSVQEAGTGRVTGIFGIPLANDDDALRALRVADELVGVGDGIRVGVATGEVLIEDREGSQRLLSTGPVEAAEELAASSEPGVAWLDPRTERLTRSTALSQPASEDAYRLVTSDPARPAMETPFVGRSSELDAIGVAFKRVVRDRAGSLVTILGSAGVGKSALIGTFLASLEGATVAGGRCLAYGREISFWPVAEIVHQLGGLTGAEDDPTVLSRLEEIVGEDPDAAFIARQVAAVTGAGAISPSPDELHWAIRRFLESVASEQPLVLVFDDMHWADETLLELVTYLATWIKDAPVLLICAARSELIEGRPSWGTGRVDAVNLSLDALPPADADEMIRAVLGGELEDEMARTIHETTEGHPLFIRELLSMLRDEGALVEKGGPWVAVADVPSLPIPPTVRAVLDARLDRSSPQQRHVLEIASIVGRDFTLANLSSLGAVEDLTTTLDELIERDLVAAGGGSRMARAYRFRHILLRDAAYAGIAKELRARYHEAFASALENSEEEHIAGFDEIAGYHLESSHAYLVELGGAVDPSVAHRAATHLASAAARALEIEDMPAAASLASRARALIDPADARFPATALTEAVALFDLGRTADAESVLEEGIAAAPATGDESMEWRLRVEQLDIRLWLGPEGEEHARAAREAVEVFERLGDTRGRARALRLLGDALHYESRFDEAVPAFREGRRLALESGDEREASQRPGFGVVMGPMPARSCIEIVESSMASATRPNPDGMGQLALLFAMDGRLDAAREMAERAVTRARELGEWRAAPVEMYTGLTYLALDDPEAAESVLRPAVDALHAVGERNLLSSAAALLGETRFRRGDFDEALTMAQRSQEASAPGDHIAGMQWRQLRAKVMAVAGDLDEAERLSVEACRIAREEFLGGPHIAGDAFLDRSFVLERAGRLEEAGAAADEALAKYRAKGDVTSASKVEAVRERLRLEVGRLSSSEG